MAEFNDGIYLLPTIQAAANVLHVPTRWLRYRLDSGEAHFEQGGVEKRRELHRLGVERLADTCSLTPSWARAI